LFTNYYKYYQLLPNTTNSLRVEVGVLGDSPTLRRAVPHIYRETPSRIFCPGIWRRVLISSSV